MKLPLLLLLLFITLLTPSHQTDSCPDGETQIGNLCLSPSQLAICDENLSHLDNKETNNESITNECEPFTGPSFQQAFKFTVTFINDFIPDLDCLTFEVRFEDVLLNEGDFPQFNTWKYNVVTREIEFNILHEDMEDLYQCELIENSSSYTWLCDMSVHILFGGKEQLQYNFKIQITMERDAKAGNNTDGEEFTIQVERMLITGQCCENELQIETALRFCTDFSCTAYLQGPIKVKRRDLFIAEHYIVNPEFQHYYLTGLQLKLGPYFPIIVGRNGNNPGRFIWASRANIAMDNLLLESIAEISNKPPTGRRFLQENDQIREDYKVKAEISMIVQDEGADLTSQEDGDNNKIIKEAGSTEEQNMSLIIGVIATGLVIISCVIGGTIYFVRKRGQQQKKEEKEVQKREQNEKENVKQITDVSSLQLKVQKQTEAV